VASAHEECLIIQEIQHKHFIKKYMNDFIARCIRAKGKMGVVQQEDKEYLKQLEAERKKKKVTPPSISKSIFSEKKKGT
jgi:hypothetical protein